MRVIAIIARQVLREALRSRVLHGASDWRSPARSPAD